MKVNFDKIELIIIRDKDENIIDRFSLGKIVLTKNKLTSNSLELYKK